LTTEPERKDAGLVALSDALDVSFRVLRYVMLLLVVLYLLSGFYTVDQHERALVLSFGKAGTGPDRIKEPGFRLTLPRPFSRVIKVETERTHTVESDSFAAPFSDPSELLEDPAMRGLPGPSDPFGYTLTADANVLHTKWALRYQISDPEAYAFRYKDLDTVLRNELDHAVVKVSSQLRIDEALQSEIEQFRAEIETELRDRIGRLGLGVRLERVDVLSRDPPQEVAAAFSEVNAAEQDRSRMIHEARGKASTLLNRAQGEAARSVSQAKAYRKRIVGEVAADADYFEKVLAKYRESPEVLARTLHQDTLSRTMRQVQDKYFVPKDRSGNQEIRISVTPEKAPLQRLEISGKGS
jgi:membrane protease subunit HflK